MFLKTLIACVALTFAASCSPGQTSPATTQDASDLIAEVASYQNPEGNRFELVLFADGDVALRQATDTEPTTKSLQLLGDEMDRLALMRNSTSIGSAGDIRAFQMHGAVRPIVHRVDGIVHVWFANNGTVVDGTLVAWGPNV